MNHVDINCYDLRKPTLNSAKAHLISLDNKIRGLERHTTYRKQGRQDGGRKRMLQYGYRMLDPGMYETLMIIVNMS